jgi:MFS family permease
VAWFNDRYGRKAAIILGTCFCIVGVALQTSAINSIDALTPLQINQTLTLFATSWHVPSWTVHYRDRNVSSSPGPILEYTASDYH